MALRSVYCADVPLRNCSLTYLLLHTNSINILVPFVEFFCIKILQHLSDTVVLNFTRMLSVNYELAVIIIKRWLYACFSLIIILLYIRTREVFKSQRKLASTVIVCSLLGQY